MLNTNINTSIKTNMNTNTNLNTNTSSDENANAITNAYICSDVYTNPMTERKHKEERLKLVGRSPTGPFNHSMQRQKEILCKCK